MKKKQESSRIRTDRRLTVSGGGMPHPAHTTPWTYHPPSEQTDARENITFLHTTYAVGNETRRISRYLRRTLRIRQCQCVGNIYLKFVIYFGEVDFENFSVRTLSAVHTREVRN